MTRRTTALVLVAGLLLSATSRLVAHDGPPFPIVSDQRAGPYTISVWTDPDTTDDGTAGGQFWVMLSLQDGSRPVPPDTRATIVTRPIDRPGEPESVRTEPVRDDPSTQFGAVLFNHEGRFSVQVSVNGPLGRATVDSEVAATYDLRPPPLTVVLYLMPFIVVGLIWTKLLLRRRAADAAAVDPEARGPAGPSTASR